VKIMSEEIDRKAIRQKMDALNQEARDNWHDLQWRQAMAAEMTETIYEGFEFENLLDIMTDVERAGEFDQVYIKEVRGLRAFWIALGGDIEASTLTEDVMSVPRENLAFRVDEFEDKLLSNFAETQATVVDLGIQRMQAEVNRRFLKLIQAAIPSGSDQYISGAGLSLTALNAALREVRDESRSGDIAIIGRATMIDQIYDQVADGAGFWPETNEEFLRRGSLGVYRGARLVNLSNYKDDQGISFFPANELFIIGRDASKFVLWGQPKSKEWTDTDWYWHYQARMQVGGVVHRPERARRVVDTSQVA
jgi:hypothetical protein